MKVNPYKKIIYSFFYETIVSTQCDKQTIISELLLNFSLKCVVSRGEEKEKNKPRKENCSQVTTLRGRDFRRSSRPSPDVPSIYGRSISSYTHMTSSSH
jgi:hypothetical protein